MVRIVNDIKYLTEITKSLDPLGYLTRSKKNSREINIDIDSDEDLPLL